MNIMELLVKLNIVVFSCTQITSVWRFENKVDDVPQLDDSGSCESEVGGCLSLYSLWCEEICRVCGYEVGQYDTRLILFGIGTGLWSRILACCSRLFWHRLWHKLWTGIVASTIEAKEDKEGRVGASKAKLNIMLGNAKSVDQSTDV
ncbi:unnamed protein product [Vicia faba]|uniref:Uncharacterized protein n=1 Tax=Vicia faba TaxID=3906 RepID=A0AAV1B142_VICFA|nr:unnamed protein product [Vicia faba]